MAKVSQNGCSITRLRLLPRTRLDGWVVGLHVHDLRHVGNDLRSPGASLRDLMAHMGHSTQNAALVYQHVDVQRQREMAARLSKAIEQAVWPTSGPGRSSAGRKAKRSARSQGL